MEHIEGQISAAGLERDALCDEILWPGRGKRRKLTDQGGRARRQEILGVETAAEVLVAELLVHPAASSPGVAPQFADHPLPLDLPAEEKAWRCFC
jgi:hypothetical protein